MTKPIFQLSVEEVCEAYKVLPHLARQKRQASAMGAFKNNPNDERLEDWIPWIKRELERLERALKSWEPPKKKYRDHVPEIKTQALPNYKPKHGIRTMDERQRRMVADAERNLIFQMFERGNGVPPKMFAQVFRCTLNQAVSRINYWVSVWNSIHKDNKKKKVSLPKKKKKPNKKKELLLGW